MALKEAKVMRKRSLLLVATLAWVAPLSAAQGPVSTPQARSHAKGDCPAARARARAEAAARQKGAWTAPRTIAQPVDVPAEGSIFAIGRSSSVLMP
jgi:hypothetical protein